MVQLFFAKLPLNPSIFSLLEKERKRQRERLLREKVKKKRKKKDILEKNVKNVG